MSSCKEKRKRQSKQKKNDKLSFKETSSIGKTDAQFKVLDDVIFEVAAQQELDSSYTDADCDSSGELSTQVVNCKNSFKFCEEVCRLNIKYCLKVDKRQSEIVYVKSRVSFLSTCFDIHDQPERCNQINEPFNAAERSDIQPGASEKSSSQIVQVDLQDLSTSLPSDLTWIIRGFEFVTDDDG